MTVRILLLLYLSGHVFAHDPPDVECLVVHLEYVSCSWNEQGTPEVNYTFSSRYANRPVHGCPAYLLENNTAIGCHQSYTKGDKFLTFYTYLTHGNDTYKKEHDLKPRVKLNPPFNLSVQNGSDFNLWYYWNQSYGSCVEHEVRHRKNQRNWETSMVFNGKQNYCINLPSSTSRYELQVRSRISDSCGESMFWSDWSEPVVWGSNNGTADAIGPANSLSVWTLVLSVVGVIVLIMLVVMLLHHERVRIILIPVVPKPSLSPNDIEDWFKFSKGLKEGFKANYNERACPVREYTYIPRSDSESSDSSSLSFTTNQTDCSVSIPVNEPEDLSFSHMSSTVCSDETQPISV